MERIPMVNMQHRLAELLCRTPSALIPDAARATARLALLDTLAVALAAAHEDVVRIVADYARPARLDTGVPGWTTGLRYAPEAAALLNAVAAHALDYDDVTSAWRGHPSAVLWPALQAVGHEAATFGCLLDGYVLGVEAGACIAMGLADTHYAAGWHPTCTIGTLAATAACARALALDVETTRHALGLAAAQVAGMRVQFGTMAKPLQVGFAAAAAVRTVHLAQAGAQASDRALDGSAGFFQLYAGMPSGHDAPRPPIRDPKAAILMPAIEVKQFPNCYAAHRAVVAALALRASAALDPDAIASVLIEGSPGAHAPLLRCMPTTADEARFSIEYAVACALLDGGLGFESFNDKALQRPAIQRLLAVSAARETQTLGPPRSARVTVTLRDGTPLHHIVRDLAGHPHDTPAAPELLHGKVMDCLARTGLGSHVPSLLRETLAAAPEGQFHRMESAVFCAMFSTLFSNDK